MIISCQAKARENRATSRLNKAQKVNLHGLFSTFQKIPAGWKQLQVNLVVASHINVVCAGDTPLIVMAWGGVHLARLAKLYVRIVNMYEFCLLNELFNTDS